ncbi:hypothetical protein HDU79_000989 [Rhizoclosmatium sp. JEL0117]|nr:hypothetical protein HDU79_000989 [Rhizoclosmatium sp. JEL0117]
MRLEDTNEALANEITNNSMICNEKEEAERSELRKQLKSAISEVDRLADSLYYHETHHSEALEKIKVLQGKLIEYEKMLIQKDVDARGLKREVASLEGRLAFSEMKATRLLSGILSSKATSVTPLLSNTITTETNSLKAQLTTETLTNAALQKLLRDSQVKRLSLTSELIALERNCEATRSTVDTLEITIQEEQEIKIQLIKKISSLKCLMKENEAVNSKQAATIRKLESSLTQCNANLHHLKEELSQSRETIQSLEVKIYELESTLREKDEKNTQLKECWFQDQKTIHQMKKDIESFHEQYLSLSDSFVALQNQLDEEEDVSDGARRQNVIEGFQVNEKLEELNRLFSSI